MPEMQSPVPANPNPMPVVMDAAPSLEDPDYAFGCECADPALQIAWWGQDARGAGVEAS
jgi:hypothetical protein